MAKSLEEVLQIKESLKFDYQARHAAFKSLRNYWWGNYWDDVDQSTRSVSSAFRDIVRTASDVGPDLHINHNVIQQICIKYQSFLSPLPQIHVYVDPPQSEQRKNQATKKERYLYGSWAAGNMSKRFNNMGWYLPLMGSCYLGIHPDFDRKLPLPLIRSPEYAYPIPGYNGDEDGVIFCWQVPESTIRRNYPDYQPRQSPQGRLGVFRKKARPSDPKIDLLEFSDKNEFVRFADEQKLNGVEHNFGFSLWEHFKFIDVPDEMFGHGAVEQAISLQEMGDALYSLLFMAVIDNVFPKLILEDPSKAPEEIPSGAGVAIGLNPGGKAYYLTAPAGTTAFQTGFMEQNAQHIKQSSGLSEPNFGQSPVTSRVSGAAIDELLGAGAGTTVEMVQGSLGTGISRWNEKAIYIGQEMFAKDTINVMGTEVTPMALNPRRFSESFKGSQLVGSSRNEVYFSPGLNQHEKLVMWLQALGGGLISKAYARDQIGIPDNQAMEEEIFSEQIELGVLGAIMAELQAAPDPANAEKVENEGYAFLQGQTAQGAIAAATAPQGPPGALPSGPPPGPPPTAGAPPAGPAGGAPSGPAPANPAPSAPSGAAGNANTITLDAAVAAFQQVQVTGRVFLVGEIVQRGQTDGDIEVALTEQSDQDALSSGLPQFAARMVFHLVSSEPSEPHVEVTQGKPADRGGAEQASPEALRGVFVG